VGAKVKAQGGNRGFFAALAVVAVAGAAALGWVLSRGAPQATLLPEGTTLPVAAGYVMGDSTAPVTIIEFGDFECPACAQFATLTAPDVKARLVATGQVQYRFYDYPLPSHPNSIPASMAAACAADQGRFWEMHDALFGVQDRWATVRTTRPKGVFKELAQQIGLDVGTWETCFDANRHLDRITAHAREGERLGVPSTPTFLIGRRKVPGALGYDQLKAYVDSAMADTGRS
jgi:protein-disulfide isomerase